MQVFKIYDFPGRTLRLTYNTPDDVQAPEALAELALRMLFNACDGFCALLAVEVAPACCDPETRYPWSSPPQPCWFLHQRQLPPRVVLHPMYVNIPTAVEHVTPAITLAWLRPLLAQPCAGSEDTLLSWHELRFDTTLVRLPTGVAPLSATTLPVRERNNILDYPLVWQNGAAWVGGPIKPQTLNAPLELRLVNEAGLFTLDITYYWSIWWDDDSPGRPLLRQTLDRLTADGWSIT